MDAFAPGGLLLVRHGQTEWSRAGRHTGRTDLALEPDGVRQASEVGTFLRRLDPPDRALSSPLRRAAETCRLAGFGHDVQLEADLMEWDYGDYEGRRTDDIRIERPGWSLWSDGVPNGETATDVGRRADRVIATAREAGGTTLCFAHGHLLRVLAARWTGLPAVGGRLLVLYPATVSELGWEREVPVIARWNEQIRPPR